MSKFFMKAAAVLSAAVLAVSFTGCGSKDSSSSSAGQDVKAEDMPYGANMIKHLKDDGYEITTEVDYRYISEDESKKIAKYIAAIGSSKGSLMEESVYPGALDYVMKATGCATADDYASMLHQQLMQFTGEEYEFEYTVTEAYAAGDSVDFSTYDKIVHDYDPDAEITDRKKLSMDALYDHTNKSIYVRMGGYIEIYLYTINGVPYVLS